MKKEDIHLGDWQRILIGDAPAEFLLEVFIRTALIYGALIVIMRYLGKRMNGQLTILELSVMLTLGAIVSSAMQLPDRGLLPGVLALLCSLFFLRATNWAGFKRSNVEKLIQGSETVLVKDGVIQLDKMADNRLSHQQIYRALRDGQVYNLGRVKRLYLEAYGMFSIYEDAKGRPGLSVLPPADLAIQSIHSHPDRSYFACTNCGYALPTATKPGECPVCHANDWVEAVL